MLRVLSSSRLALVLVALIILLAIAGAVVPQEHAVDPAGFLAWQQARPILSNVLRPLGLFHVFRSWPFLFIVVVLGINTLTCTILHLAKLGLRSLLQGPRAVERVGFVLVHTSLLLLFAGGIWSGLTRKSGVIILTEGQQGLVGYQDGGFQLLDERAARPRAGAFPVYLDNIKANYEKKLYQVSVTSHLEALSPQGNVIKGDVKFNEPVTYNDVTFTLAEIGYSPRLIIRHPSTGTLLGDAYVALKTFRKGKSREYRDFLPLTFLDNRIVVTLYPSFAQTGGRITKGAEEPGNPLLVLDAENKSGQVESRSYLAVGDTVTLGEFSFQFAGLRQWASFQAAQDPGYPLVMFSLWLGLAAFALRYFPEVWRWFREESVAARDSEKSAARVRVTSDEELELVARM